jgi:autotransporter-associated beta strand protein
MKMFRIKSVAGILSAVFVLLSIQASRAGSATWALNPQSGDWNNPANWTPPTVPNGPNDTARFGVSNITSISTSADVEVASIVFMPGASQYNLGSYGWNQTTLGLRVTNNSGITQNFVTAGDGIPGDVSEIQFLNSATAGNLTVYTNEGAAVNGELGGETEFFNTSTAGHATLIADGGTTTGAGAGMIVFHDSSTAGNATLIANGGTNGGGGGVIEFLDFSTGGTASVSLSGNDFFDFPILDLHSTTPPGVTIGSITGDSGGRVYLGANKLTVGNNASTEFDGIISGTGGSLTKVGAGTLTLGGANTYTGATTVNAGTLLLVRNGNSSQTGTGPVTVTAGMLGGDGIVGGNLTIGNGGGQRANIRQQIDNLTVNKKLIFKSDGDYDWQINSSDLTSGMVIAKGVTIANGAQFIASDLGVATLPQGMVLTIIKNTSQLPIRGTFSNLPDGTLLTVGANTILISYHGGTSGLDLTGTVE